MTQVTEQVKKNGNNGQAELIEARANRVERNEPSPSPQEPVHPKPTVQPLQFVTGLPRSGSTLLMNLLGQCGRHHVTPSSGLIDMVVGARNQWMHNVWFKAEGLDEVTPKILSMFQGMMLGFHAKPLGDSRIVFDKSRGWIAYLELLEEIFEQKIKLIVTVREIGRAHV